jgi:hypothetical protein
MLEKEGVNQVIMAEITNSRKSFKEERLKKRTQFHELIHSAFILETSVTFYLTRPQPTDKELSWMAWTYPNSIIEKGNDQGAFYCTITPKI